jgi:hypothetical protein
MTNGAAELVRMPESDVVEGAARYLAVVRPQRLVEPRKELEGKNDVAVERPSRPLRRR